MCEHKSRSRHRDEILKAATKCVYCDSIEVTTIEHMPPRGLFKNKDRPNGWEFACCQECNEKTRGSDAVAQLLSQIEPINNSTWKLNNISKLIAPIEKYAPGVMEEINGKSPWSGKLISRNGILHKTISKRVSGPETKHHLNIFSAKVAMAAFCEIIGRPIKNKHLIHTEWFLNAGLSIENYNLIISIMPSFKTMVQGKKNSFGQFGLKYNTNKKDILAALFSFHDSLFVKVIITDGEDFIEPLEKSFSKLTGPRFPTANMITNGLIKMISDKNVLTHKQQN